MLNFRDKRLEQYNPKIFVTQKFPTNYVPTAYDSFVNESLKKVTENYQASIENLIEMVSAVLYPDILISKMWYLYGKSPANGKSSILNLVQQSFNKDGGNIASISPHKLSTNNFASVAMANHTYC